MDFLRDRITPVLVTVGAGVVIGALGALAGKVDSPLFHAVSLVFSGGWSWACLALLVGYFRQSKVEAALLAASALAIGVAVYYLLKALAPVTPIGMDITVEPTGGVAWPRIAIWGALAFVFGAPVGLIGNLARIPGVSGLLFRLLGPLIAFVETSWRLDVEAAAAGPTAESTWSTVRVLAVLAAVVLAGHSVWGWRGRRDSPKVGADAE